MPQQQEKKKTIATIEKLEKGLKIGSIAMSTILGLLQIYLVVRNDNEPVSTI